MLNIIYKITKSDEEGNNEQHVKGYAMADYMAEPEETKKLCDDMQNKDQAHWYRVYRVAVQYDGLKGYNGAAAKVTELAQECIY